MIIIEAMSIASVILFIYMAGLLIWKRWGSSRHDFEAACACGVVAILAISIYAAAVQAP